MIVWDETPWPIALRSGGDFNGVSALGSHTNGPIAGKASENPSKKKKLMENAPKLETRPETNGNGTELVSSLCKFQRFNLNKTTERNGSLDVRFDISKPKMDEWSIQFHVLVRNSNQTVWFGKFFDLKWRQIALKLSASIRFRQLRRNGQLRTFEISFREFNSIEIQQTNLKLNRICGNWSKMNF